MYKGNSGTPWKLKFLKQLTYTKQINFYKINFPYIQVNISISNVGYLEYLTRVLMLYSTAGAKMRCLDLKKCMDWIYSS